MPVSTTDNRLSSPLRDPESPLPTNEVSSHSRQNSTYNRYLPAHRSPSRRERSYSPNPNHHGYSSRCLRSPSHDRNYDQYQHQLSHSRSPRCYKDDHDRHHYRRSHSRSPRQGKYNSDRYPYRSERPDSPRYGYDHHEQHHYPRKHSKSPHRDRVPPRRAEIKPLELSEQLPDPPDGWNDKGYYLSAPVSYEIGGKNGDRAGGKRGGPSMIFDKNGTKVKYKTFLEKMSKEDKYLFIKEHNHPFADIVGIPYFNPYGKVPLDDKLTAIIYKPVGALFVSSGQHLDFPEYLEGRAVTRAAVVCNIPNNATIAPGKFLTWAHFGLSVRLQVYHYVYQIKPYYYHFRDKTGENNWLIDSKAREYLKEVGGYLKKTGNQTADPVDYLHRHESKNVKNKGIQKSYIEEPDTDNPYYFPKFGADKKYAGSTRALEALTEHTAPASSSTKAYDARRADRIVAQEEARAKDEARATKPGKSAPAKGVPKTGGAKVKTETKAKRRMVSDEESDDNGSKIVSRPAETKVKSPVKDSHARPSLKTKPKPKQKEPESEEELDEPEQLLAMEFVKKPNKAKSKQVEPEEKEEEPMGEAPVQAKSMKQKKSKQKIASSKVDKLEEYEPPMKETAKPDKAPLPLKLKLKEKESEDDSEKGILSIKEHARRKMLPRREPEPKENEPQQSEDDEVGKEAAAKSRSKSKQLALSPEAGEPEESEKSNNQAVSSKQGRKRPLQPRAKEDKEEEEEEEEEG